MAFNQQEERDCNKAVKSLNPGPGAYIDINDPNTNMLYGIRIYDHTEKKGNVLVNILGLYACLEW